MKQLLRSNIALLVFLCTLCFALQSAFAASDDVIWPTEGWQAAAPEEVGVRSAALVALLETNPDVHTIMAVRNGKVVLDVSRYPFDSSQPHSLFSVTKSVVSIAMGIAIDKGYIQSVEQSIWDFFPQDKTANMDIRKEAITIEDLLTQTSGLAVTDDLGIYALTADDPSWVQFILDSKMYREPGTYFQYLDANAHLASAVIQLATGMSVMDFTSQYLFEPLGITDALWASDPQGVSVGGTHLFMSASSMAKLGYLYLHEGEWDGQQIVSANWVAKSTNGTIPGPFWDKYAYLWSNGTFQGTDIQGFSAVGYRGQAIWVVPELDLVVVTTGDANMFNQNVVTAIVNAAEEGDSLPSDQAANDNLQSIVDLWANPVAGSIRPIADSLKEFSGHTYQLEVNDLGWKTFSIDFAKPEEAIITLGLVDCQLTLPVGFDNLYRISSDGLPAEQIWRPIGNVPLLMRGGALGKKLILTMEDLMSMDIWTLSIDFSADGTRIWIAVQSSNDGETMTPQPHSLVGDRAPE